MHRSRAKLYIFEGPDGVGKTTLARAFAEALSQNGVKCVVMSFPGQEARTLGKWVYDIHHAPRNTLESLSPSSLQVLHVAAHVDAIETRILPALQHGITVVLDRFWWSTWAYGRASGVPERVLTAMLRVERLFWRSRRPTAVFLVDRLPPSVDDSLAMPANRLAVQQAYMGLARREQRKYPIHQLANDGRVEAAVNLALEAVSGSSRSAPGPSASLQQALLFKAPSRQSSPTVFSRLAPAKPTVVFDTYWRFAAERQVIFHRRVAGAPAPWTSDPILARHKFTNAYRASDRVSQYLIRNVIYSGEQSPEELFFRILLFKFFNKIETWELLQQALNRIAYDEYSFERYDRVLSTAQGRGESIYSAAYIMPTGGKAFPSGPKHRMHLLLLDRMMRDELPARIFAAKRLGTVFELLRSYPTIGDFLAYQYATDLNYSALMPDLEGDFVVPGPGARDGIRKCFSDLGGLNESELIRFVADRQDDEVARLGLRFRDLWGRPLQLIDCQNLFCETDKYARAKHPEFSGRTGRTRIKQRFAPRPESLRVWYPPKWGINQKIPPQYQALMAEPTVSPGGRQTHVDDE